MLGLDEVLFGSRRLEIAEAGYSHEPGTHSKDCLPLTKQTASLGFRHRAGCAEIHDETLSGQKKNRYRRRLHRHQNHQTPLASPKLCFLLLEFLSGHESYVHNIL